MSLKALKQELDTQAAARAEREANGGGSFQKAVRDYELLKESSSIKFRLMQELDTDAEFYDADRGIGLVTPIHQTPFGVKPFRAARCTKESEGNCYGCERYANRDDENAKGWRPQTTVYVNALAEVDGEFKPFVFGQKARSALVEFLIEYSGETNTVTDVVLKLTKSGVGKDTKYTVLQLRTKPEDFPIGDHPIFPVEQAIANIEYAKQPAFYGGAVASAEEGTTAPVKVAATTADDDAW